MEPQRSRIPLRLTAASGCTRLSSVAVPTAALCSRKKILSLDVTGGSGTSESSEHKSGRVHRTVDFVWLERYAPPAHPGPPSRDQRRSDYHLDVARGRVCSAVGVHRTADECLAKTWGVRLANWPLRTDLCDCAALVLRQATKGPGKVTAVPGHDALLPGRINPIPLKPRFAAGRTRSVGVRRLAQRRIAPAIE